jgi:hypothetical protein
MIGPYAGYLITSGGKNTIIGGYNGNQGGLDIRTSSNNIVLSDGDGNVRLYINSSGSMLLDGATSSIGSQGHLLQHSDYSGTYRTTSISASYLHAFASDVTSTKKVHAAIFADGDIVNTNNSYGSLSDQTLKENVIDASSQWDDIKAVQVRKYSLIAENAPSANRIGVVAQELESSGMSGLVKETDDGLKTVKYSVLYMKAVKALQEAMDRIETLEARITALENA